MSNLREECGVFGIVSTDTVPVAETAYYGLFALQHRGQESCGIVVNDEGLFRYYKDIGLVGDVFTKDVIESLGYGNMACGHVRYGTCGRNDRLNSQPIVVNHHKGKMALAHNGNLVNSFELRQALELEGSIFHTTSDTEVISYIITKERIKASSIELAVSRAMDKLKGAYSLVIMSPSKLIAARDPHGFRPLCYGKRKDGSYVVASESCALDSVDADFVRDIKPGEIVVFERRDEKIEIRTIEEKCNISPKKICIFEYIYFARPDSVIEGKGVHNVRLKAGARLAKDYPVNADVVIGVPDSGIDAAIGYACESNIPYGVGFIKNKYIGRTFIAPGQSSREDKVKIKLNVVKNNIKDKKVVLVDDSIVRGTTIKRIIKLLKDAGALEVHVRSAAPPFKNPCYYGTDVDSRENLIACKYSIDEIAGVLGADSVGYLKMDALGEIIDSKVNVGYCHGCFSGEYATDIPTNECNNKFEQKIPKQR